MRRCTGHAGESSGPEGVWDAVALLGADRVDHGVRAIENPAPVRMLANRQIALFGWTDDTMRAVARTSIDASFADDDTKNRLRAALDQW